VAVGDVGEVPDWTRTEGHAACGDYRRGAGRKHHSGLVSGHGSGELDSSREQSGIRISICHGTWSGLWAAGLHYEDAGGADGMRINRLELGDVSEVSCGTWHSRDSSSGDDSRRGAGRKHLSGLVSGHGNDERDSSQKSSRHRIDIRDGTRIRLRGLAVHEQGAGGRDRMRVDDVGVRDVGEVSGWARSKGDTSSGDNSRRAWRQHEPGLVCGSRVAEYYTSRQSRRHRIGICDGAWIEHGARDDVHRTGTPRTDGMRVDGVAVGDVGEVPGGARRSWLATGCDDSGRARSKCKSGMVD
jgi:hypothetical protein